MDDYLKYVPIAIIILLTVPLAVVSIYRYRTIIKLVEELEVLRREMRKLEAKLSNNARTDIYNYLLVRVVEDANALEKRIENNKGANKFNELLEIYKKIAELNSELSKYSVEEINQANIIRLNKRINEELNQAASKESSKNLIEELDQKSDVDLQASPLESFELIIENNTKIFSNISINIFFIFFFIILFFSYFSNRSIKKNVALINVLTFFFDFFFKNFKNLVLNTRYERYFFFLLTVFIFIVFENLGSFYLLELPFNSHAAITLFLSFILFFNYVINFLINFNEKSHKKFIQKDVNIFIIIFLFFIEIISFFIRPLSLGVRLFANILSEHISVHIFFTAFIFVFKFIF